MWFSSKDKKIAEFIKFLVDDCDETLRELNYFATDDTRKNVARGVLEKTHRISVILGFSQLSNAAIEAHLKSELAKVTVERQQAAGRVLNVPHPRADMLWAVAALYEGFLQVCFLAKEPDDTQRLQNLLLNWIETTLGSSEMELIRRRIDTALKNSR
jgi:DNA phosphorothioation-dependent restriction protein DptG